MLDLAGDRFLRMQLVLVEAEAGVTEVTMTDDEDRTEEGRTQVSVGEESNEHLIFSKEYDNKIIDTEVITDEVENEILSDKE